MADFFSKVTIGFSLGAATSLQGGMRPRTTLTPTVAIGNAGGAKPGFGLAFGSPGGDGQDQWSLSFLLRVLHHGMDRARMHCRFVLPLIHFIPDH